MPTTPVPDTLVPSSVYSNIAKPAAANLLTPLAFYNLCKAASPSRPGAVRMRDSYIRTDFTGIMDVPPNSRYNHVMPPNSWGCAYGGRWGDAGGAYTATSRHPGVVNLLMCDGSVRSAKNSISNMVWWCSGPGAAER